MLTQILQNNSALLPFLQKGMSLEQIARQMAAANNIDINQLIN